MPTPFSRTTRSLAADSPRTTWFVWAGAGVCLVAWLTWFFFGGVTVYEVSRSARLEAGQAPYAVASTVAGKLSISHLVLGRAVAAGDVLVELDASSERLRLQEEEARARTIPARIASLRAEIAAVEAMGSADLRSSQAAVQASLARVREAGASADFAQDNARRMDAESGSGSIAEIDALRARTESRKLGSAHDALLADARRIALDAETRNHQGHAQIEGLRRTLAGLDGDLATARATAARLAVEIDRHRLRAPVAGTVAEATPLGEGAFVAEGARIATIVPDGALRLVADFVPASALGRLQPGQTAHLRLDGFPWAQYGRVDATVERVAGEVRDNVLRVELAPHDRGAEGPVLRHGLTGVVEVAIERTSPAVLLLRASTRRFMQPARGQLAASEAR